VRVEDLNLLRAFEALWMSRSVTLAAERLGLSQAAVSASLKRLRADYHDQLFTLVGRRMEPTPLATHIAPAILDALVLVRKTKEAPQAFDPSVSNRMFVVRTRDIGEVVCFPPIMRKLAQQAPSIKLRTVFTPIPETLSGLAGGQLDIALGFLPSLEAGIHKLPLFKQRYVCLMRADHPLCQRTLTKKLLSQQSHLLVEYSGSGHVVLERELVKLSGRDSIKVRLPQYLSAPHFIASSDLLWIAPAVLAYELQKTYALITKPVPIDLPEFEVALYWHERFHEDPGNKWFRRFVSDELKAIVSMHAKT
jgi:DNA-binding transcriptional LysR family regulator